MDNKSRKRIGLNGRKKMEKEFDRKFVVDKYMNYIKE